MIDEIGDLRVGIEKKRVGTHLNIRELLTDEQKIKFDNHPPFRFMQGGGNQVRCRMWDNLDE